MIRKRNILFVLFGVFLSIACALAYLRPWAKRPNLILICLDALRADHLGCYGYSRDTTPNIDRLASEGVVFEKAFSQSSFTLPSIASLFTSKYVSSHKADRIERRLADSQITLAEVLKASGYNTAAFIYNATQFDPVFGLNQGFNTYSIGEESDRKPSFAKTLPACLDWLKANRQKPFFIFLHSNDIHEPYHSVYENFFDPAYRGRLDNEYMASGTPFHKNNLKRTPREVEHIIAHYDGGIKYADTFIGKLIKQLEEWGLLEKTAIIIFSDHGEILSDRGKQFCHGFSVHDEEAHVPLIISGPQVKALRVSCQVQLIDVMPTILDLLRINRKNLKLEGRSLAPLLRPGVKNCPHNYVYAECIKGESQEEGFIDREVMVRSASWKLIGSFWRFNKPLAKYPKSVQLHNYSIISTDGKDGFELYYLENDPKEARNLYYDGPSKIKAELLDKLVSNF
ncbi:MAG: sulfatase [Candidatus Omnitrophota bacterium]